MTTVVRHFLISSGYEPGRPQEDRLPACQLLSDFDLDSITNNKWCQPSSLGPYSCVSEWRIVAQHFNAIFNSCLVCGFL